MKLAALILLGVMPAGAASLRGAESPTHCMLEFKSENPKQLLSSILKHLSPARPEVGQLAEGSKNDILLGELHSFVQTFDFAPRQTEQLAKALARMAPLNFYQCGPQLSAFQAQQLASIEDSIRTLEGELKGNSKALSSMPITRALLQANLQSLYSSRDSLRRGNRSEILVTVLDVH